MRVLDPVSLILRKKGSDIWSIPSDATVYSAMQMMADGRGSKETPVNEIMVASPITIRPECPVEEAMQLITTNRIRHLPVVCDGKILGMISIGDLVNWIAFAQDHAIEQLEHYIEGKYPC